MAKKKITMTQEDDTLTIEKAMNKFVEYKEYMNKSEKTIKNYKDAYKELCMIVNPSDDLRTITKETIYLFVKYKKEINPNIKDVSIQSYLRQLKVILYYFMSEGYLDNFKIELPSVDEQFWITYNEEQISKLIKKPNIKKCNFPDYRNWVICCYLLGTGNRLSNVRNLKIEDINFESKEILLTKTKSKKVYTIPLSETLSTILKEYLKYRKPDKKEDYVFVTQYHDQMTTTGLETALNRYHARRGVSITNIHLYRHTFAKQFILNGGDPFRLKAILGHTTMTMVDKYVNMWGKDLQKDFDKFNPLDNVADQVIKRQVLRLEK